MPKLLQINVCANWGSTGKIAEQLNDYMRYKGWKTFFAYGRSVNPNLSHLIHIGNKFFQAIALFEARLFDNDGLSCRFATMRLIKKIKKVKPDIIHIHNLHGYYVNYRLLFNYLNSTNIPIVWTFHDCWAFTGHCGHFVTVGCEKWKIACHDCPLKKDYPSSILLDGSNRNYLLKKRLFAASNNVHIVVVSDWLKGLVKQSYLKNKDIRVINNGVNLDVFKPSQGFSHPKIEETDFVMIAVSSQWKSGLKGYDDYIKLSGLLKTDEKIILVGVTDEIINELPYNIIGIKHTNNQKELAEIYSRANVVLSFSKAETFGLTIVEGFACGTPAIVYNNTALPELIAEETGFVVSDGDVQRVYEILQYIKEKGKAFFTAKCRASAERLYGLEMQYEKYLNLYNNLLKKEVKN